MPTKDIILIGYSGHAYVIVDIFNSQGINVIGYCDIEEKKQNPYKLIYMGNEKEQSTLSQIAAYDYFAAIGHNGIRKKVLEFVEKENNKRATNAIHCTACVSPTAQLAHGIMVSNYAQINAMCTIGSGVICNTGSIIEHECKIGAYSHIAPGAVLCGNVSVGENTMIGARTVIKPGITIGDNVIIGAGTVVLADVPDKSKIVGNPSRFL